MLGENLRAHRARRLGIPLLLRDRTLIDPSAERSKCCAIERVTDRFPFGINDYVGGCRRFEPQAARRIASLNQTRGPKAS